MTLQQRFEKALAYHCAPSMLGIKAADMISWHGPVEETRAMVAHYDRLLNRRGIRLRLLFSCPKRCLLLIYRQERLELQLALPQAQSMRRDAGYPERCTAEELLDHLSLRLQEQDFPHEVGLFLGYPPADVEGFCRYGGRACKFTGHWKVYDRVDEARECFRRFDRCRDAMCRRMEEGRSLAQILGAA